MTLKNEYSIFSKNFLLIMIANSLGFLGLNMATAGVPAYLSILVDNNVYIGLATTLAAIAALISRPLAGKYLNERNIKIVTAAGFIIMCIPACVLFQFQSIWVILALRFAQGFGWGLASTGCSCMIANASKVSSLSKRIGISSAVSSVFTALAPTLVILIFEKTNGSLMILSIGIIFLLAFFFVAIVGKCDNNFMKKQNCSSASIKIKAISSASLIFFVTFIYSPIITYVVPITNQNKIGNVSWFYIVYAIFTVGARLLTGLYVEKFGCKMPSYLSMVFAFFSAIIMGFSNNLILLCIAGAFSGLSMGIGMVALQTFALSNGKIKREVVMAAFLFAFDFGMAIGPLFVSILSKAFGLRLSFSVLSCAALLGGILIFISSKKLNNIHLEN